MVDNTKKVVKIDGVDYEAEAPVIAELTRQLAHVDELETLVDELTTESAKTLAEKDTAVALAATEKTRADAAEAKILDPKVLQEAVAERVRILDAATILGVAVKEETTNLDAMKAVITKSSPQVKFEGKTAESAYITARFDGVVETLGTKADAKSREFAHGDSIPEDPKKPETKEGALTRDSVEIGTTANAAQKRMVERMKKDSRPYGSSAFQA